MYLGIDLGTGTLKAAIIDSDGRLMAAAEESYEAPVTAAGEADFDPTVWWDVCSRVVRRVTASQGASVQAVGVAGQMHGVVLVDGNGQPVRPAVLWPDHRAPAELARFASFDEENPGVLGNPLVPGMAGPIVGWLAHHEPESLQRATSVVQPKDWLRMQLCGPDTITDPSDASATLLYDVGADDWSAAMCESIGLPRQLLPSVEPSSQIAGRVDTRVGALLGLGPVPVAVGAGDAAAALLGASVEHPGTALINIGTGGQVMTPIRAPSSEQSLGPGLHQYRSASDATAWYGMAAIANAGLALDWVRHIVGYDWDDVYAAAALALDTAPDGPTFLPFLVGERAPSHDVIRGAVWSGLALAHDRRALMASAVRGVALYLGLRASELLRVADVSTAVISGGSARHASWVELIATVLGIDVIVADDMHLTVRGAARLAARAIGADLPDLPVGRTVSPRHDIDMTDHIRAFEAATRRHFITSG